MATCSDVSLYLCRISQWQTVPLAQLLEALSPDERKKCADFSHPDRQRSYALGRYLLRQRLAVRLDCSPSKLTLCIGPHGRPELVNGEQYFNLSHSGDWLALGFAARPLGVDIEVTRQQPRARLLAKRFFAQSEYDDLASLAPEEQTTAFLQLWCLKEAVLKAHGGGLQAGLARFSVQRHPPQLVLNQLDEHDYQLANWQMSDMHLALAIQGAIPLPPLTPQWLSP
ncbi:4'-phosphopantetheinyl transferase family protein [Pseudaeromonas paramecii]|uniref:4'-phosphopantetheinyl transferase superfamily protein n=1 Tax=Pseudaeromonas paramecii TaxID=2138166 RepID=A0ABP8Q634_9GAMM